MERIEDSGSRSVYDTPRFARLRVPRSRSVSEGEGLAVRARRETRRKKRNKTANRETI